MPDLVLIDSSVWIDFLRRTDNRQVRHLRRLQEETTDSPRIVTADLVLYEVVRGSSTEALSALHREQLQRFPVVEIGGEAAVLRAARRYRDLRAAGTTVRKSVDVLIASWCIDHGAGLLHRDRDFVPFEAAFGLQAL